MSNSIKITQTNTLEISLEKFIEACTIVQLYELEMMINKKLEAHEASFKVTNSFTVPERKALPANKKKIICLCGSTSFISTFEELNLELTLQGIIVLFIGCNTKSDDMLNLSAETKQMLDQLHFRKIDLADEIFVINNNGYIGKSTQNEINYAIKNNKPVKYLWRCP